MLEGSLAVRANSRSLVVEALLVMTIFSFNSVG
jgi:hypothetical protein